VAGRRFGTKLPDQHSCSSRWRSSTSQRTAACCAVALMIGTQILGALDA